MQGYGVNFRAPRVNLHDFSMVPRSDVPRSSFIMEHQHKTTFNFSSLIPVYCQEVLPGDTFNVQMSAFCRLATPLYPIMDNIELESFFFFVPNRLVWIHWPNFIAGEQNSPADSISYVIPQIVSPANGFPQFSLYDYFGLPTAGQTGVGNTISVSALPFRGYNLIFQEWFRDQNLQNAEATGTAGALTAGNKWIAQSDDGPDVYSNYTINVVNKRHDYFTSCLPWTQKGNPVTLPLGSTAQVISGTVGSGHIATQPAFKIGSAGATSFTLAATNASTAVTYNAAANATGGLYWNDFSTGLIADLSTATAATINSIRLAFQTQRLLERDARSGTRYAEHLRAHWGVTSADARLMRPEYLGGGKSAINIAPVPQTTATGLTGGTSPLGTLSAAGTVNMHHGFHYSATEHGHIIGIVCARNDKVYQQGIRRLFKRSTRYDFYLPVFAHLGEQSVFNYEIYSDGSANDALTFGYQERWAEYRTFPSFTSGYFRSTTTTPLDSWHLGQKFTALPALNSTFMQDDLSTTAQRVLAAGAAANNQQLLADFFFRERVARAMPMYSVPGLVDHF